MLKRKRIKIIINTYHERSQNRIFALVREYFAKAQIDEHAQVVCTCIDELIKNAIKANYKFILIMDEIKKGKSMADQHHMGAREEYEALAPVINDGDYITDRVRRILDEESRYIKVMNTAISERRTLTEGERRIISGLVNYNAVLRDIRAGKIVTAMKIGYDQDSIVVEVTNTSPLLKRDMERISGKISEFRRYREEGREMDFFINNLDTSEAGFGLGYALIDSCLSTMGIDSEKVLSIHASDVTSVKITIPLSSLPNAFSAVELEPVG